MIPSLETERKWAQPVRLEDAEQVQKVFPRWEIVKHLGAVVPWPYPPDDSWLPAPAQRCQEDLQKSWLAHKPKDIGELYSALKEDLPTRLAEAEPVGYGFVLAREVVPNVPRKGLFVASRKAARNGYTSQRITKAEGV